MRRSPIGVGEQPALRPPGARAPASTRALRLALAGGGTGGHLVPGLHLLAHLERGMGGLGGLGDLLWLTGDRAVEARVLAALPERVGEARVVRQALPLEAPGGGAPGVGRLTLRLPPAVLAARAALRAHGTQVLLALGGYACAPAVIAARTLRVPVAVLEINAVMGRATRLLGRLARRVLHAWPATCPRGDRRHVHVGPPVGPDFRAPSDPGERGGARAALGLPPARPLLVVFGGSQGASTLNTFVRLHLSTLLGGGMAVLHQVGPGKGSEAAAVVQGYRAVEYLEEVPQALAGADLVLCRGGASTLAEVASMHVPAWVVPYPHHPDRHQEHNARALGAGVRIVSEGGLDHRLARRAVTLCGPRGAGERAAMRAALVGRLPTDGAQRILAELADLARR